MEYWSSGAVPSHFLAVDPGNTSSAHMGVVRLTDAIEGWVWYHFVPYKYPIFPHPIHPSILPHQQPAFNTVLHYIKPLLESNLNHRAK